MSPAARALVAELLGTAFLLAAIVGSGIMAQRLSPGDEGLQLLENGLATAAALAALIVAFGGISGAHFNPAVSLADALLGGTPWSRVPGLVAAQVGGGALGVLLTHLAFDLPAVEVALRERAGGGLWLGEAVASLGSESEPEPAVVARAVATRGVVSGMGLVRYSSSYSILGLLARATRKRRGCTR